MVDKTIELVLDKDGNSLPSVTKQFGKSLWKFSIQKTKRMHLVIECKPSDTTKYWECKVWFDIKVVEKGSTKVSRMALKKHSSNYTNDATFSKLEENVTSVTLVFRTPELHVFEFPKELLFDEPVENITDFKFIVEGQTLYVCKKILATYSKYMYDWFDDECSQTEMIITKASCNSFRVFLGLLYYQENMVTGFKYLEIFVFGNKLNNRLDQCEEYFFKPKVGTNYLKLVTYHIPSKLLKQELISTNYDDFSLEELLTEKRSKLSDIVLSVGDRKFYVSKQLLALNSSYFNTMFYSDFVERKKDEVELKKIDADEFKIFLYLVYQPNRAITKENVQALLELSHMYDVQSIFQKYVTFVETTDEMNEVTKIKIAADFNIPELFDHILFTLDYSDLEILKGMEGFDELDDSTVAKITKYLLDEKEKSDQEEERYRYPRRRWI